MALAHDRRTRARVVPCRERPARGTPALPRREPRWLLPALAIALVLAGSRVEGGYLAVFVDGRTLHVEKVTLEGEGRAQLWLPAGGSIDIPLSRLDRVIEDEVEPNPQPVAEPACKADFADQPLPAGTPFASEILAASRKADLHPWLVAAVVQAESRFDPAAVSRVGARGLMQLMPSVWMDAGVRDPHDPRANLRAGCRHLRRLLDRFGDLRLALAAYNSGAATVEQAHGVPPYRETRTFVRHVLATFCPPSASEERPAR